MRATNGNQGRASRLGRPRQPFQMGTRPLGSQNIVRAHGDVSSVTLRSDATLLRVWGKAKERAGILPESAVGPLTWCVQCSLAYVGEKRCREGNHRRLAFPAAQGHRRHVGRVRLGEQQVPRTRAGRRPDVVRAPEGDGAAKGDVAAKLHERYHDFRRLGEAVQVTASLGHSLLAEHSNRKIVSRRIVLTIAKMQLYGKLPLMGKPKLASKGPLLNVGPKLVVGAKVKTDLAHTHAARAGKKVVEAIECCLVQAVRTVRMRPRHDAHVVKKLWYLPAHKGRRLQEIGRAHV